MKKTCDSNFTVTSTTKSSKKNDVNEKYLKVGLKGTQVYRDFVSKELKYRENIEGVKEQLEKDLEMFVGIYEIDFEPIYDELAVLYSDSDGGNSIYDPQVILRSFLFMAASKELSITNWVNNLKCNPLVAIFCGTKPNEAPCVGSHYNLLKRFENGAFESKCKHRVLPSEQRQAKVRLEPNKKKPKEKPDIEEKERNLIKKFAQEVIGKEDYPINNRLEGLLNKILFKLAVIPSAEKGIIKDLENLTAAGDGSTLPSGAAVNGKPTCDCRKQGIYDCEHDKKFSDKDAQWGWDNREKDFVFGYRYWQLVCPDNGHDLPVYVNIDPANKHEAYMAIRGIDNISKLGILLGTRISIKELALDALYDVYGVYDYLNHKTILYAIPYAKEPAKCLSLGQEGILFNDKGCPLCPGGLPMKRSSKDRYGRIIYYCPIKREARRNGKRVRVTHIDECPMECLCEPDSKMGPLCYVSEDIDLRIHPPVPRYSKRYKELSKMRSCCERSNSAKKHAYKLKQADMRVMVYAYCRLIFISILEHVKVWASKKLENFDIKKQSVFSLFI